MSVKSVQVVFAVSNLFIDSSLLQGSPGSKGDKGERVGGSVCYALFFANKEIIH